MKTEKIYKHIFENMPEGYLRASLEGEILLANPAIAQLLGYDDPEDLMGYTMYSIYSNPERREELKQQLLESKVVKKFEFKGLRKDKTEIYLESNVQLIYNEKKEPEAIEALFRDIPERKTSQEVIAEKEALSKSLLESAPDAMIVVNREGEVQITNQQATKLFGYSKGELLTMKVEDLIPERFRMGHPSHRSSFFQEHETRNMGTGLELLGLKKNGTEFPIEISLSPIERAQEKWVAAGIRDITDRVKARRLIEEKSAQLTSIMSNVDGMVYRCRNDKDWTMEFVSYGSLELTGYSSTDFTGSRVSYGESLIHPDDADPVWEIVQNALNEKISFEVEYRIKPKEGDVKWVFERGKGVYNNDGELEFLEGFIEDITEIKENETLFRSLLESTPDAMVIVEKEGNIKISNQIASILFGYSKEELSKMKAEDLTPERFRADHPINKKSFIIKHNAKNMGGGIEVVGLKKDGTEFPIEITFNPITTRQGKWVAAAIRDITKKIEARKQIEEKNAKLEQLNLSKDRIMSTVVHDLRNPITSIQGLTGILLKDLPELSDDQELMLKLIIEACEKGQVLIEELLEIAILESDEYHLETKETHLHQYLASVLTHFKQRAEEKGVKLELDIRNDEIVANINHEKFARVIENLVTNALKFTDQPGMVKVASYQNPDETVIEVKDDGIGIPENLKEFIFDKFSKARRLGLKGEKTTGIGMSIVKQIVDLHEGKIWLESEEGRGTTFYISLPTKK